MASEKASVPKAILVATDFGDVSRKALDWAVELANGLSAELFIAHVFDIPVVGLPEGAFITTAAAAVRMLDAAQAAMDTEVSHAKERARVAVQGLVKQGDPRDGVPEAARHCGAQLIVVGSKGRQGLARALLGSVAESIVRTSELPVIVVHNERGPLDEAPSGAH